MNEISTWDYTEPITKTKWTIDSAFDESILDRKTYIVNTGMSIMLIKDLKKPGTELLFREDNNYKPQYAYIDPTALDNLNPTDCFISDESTYKTVEGKLDMGSYSLLIREGSRGTISKIYNASYDTLDLSGISFDLEEFNNPMSKAKKVKVGSEMLLKLYPAFCLLHVFSLDAKFGSAKIVAYLALIDSENKTRAWISNATMTTLPAPTPYRGVTLEALYKKADSCYLNAQGLLIIRNKGLQSENNASLYMPPQDYEPQDLISILKKSLISKKALSL